MSSDEAIIWLTLGVARLGEANLLGWWRSRGLTQAGQYVLGESLPISWELSALEGDVSCATLRHDEVLARPTALHLFSDALPARHLALAWLREAKAEGRRDDTVARFRAWTVHEARRDIVEWAALNAPAGEVLGPGRRLGAVRSLDLKDPRRVGLIVRQLAAAYADQDTDIKFPYFDLSSCAELTRRSSRVVLFLRTPAGSWKHGTPLIPPPRTYAA